MQEFLIRKFVKDCENTADPQVRENYGSFAGLVGILSNAILCTIKILTGLISGSIAIMADGINNLSDASASMLTLIGFKLSGKAPNKDHPYGHGRTEYLTGLVVSVMVIAIGVKLLIDSVKKTIHPEEMDFSWVTIAILAVAILIKLWQASFNKYIGKKISSEAIIATAADSRNDVISTTAVLIATLIGKLSGLNLDGPVGILVAVFILYSGIGLVKEALDPILGQAPDPELVEALRKLIEENDRILGSHDLLIHDYGPGRIFASVHAEVDAESDIMAAHDLIDNIEIRAYKELHVLLTIHMDPLDTHDPLTKTVKMQLTEIIRTCEGVENFHDLRVVSGPTHDNLVFDVVVSADCKRPHGEVRDEVAQKLCALNGRYRCVITVDRAYS